MPIRLSTKGQAFNRLNRKSKSTIDPYLVVEQTNSLTGETVMDMFAQGMKSLIIECCCCKFAVKYKSLSDLSPCQRNKIYALTETNMKDLYLQSSWGWDSKIKREELFAPESRHLVCYLVEKNLTCSTGRHTELQTLNTSDTDPCGFVHFRFEVDCKRPVLYCYEIQLHSAVRCMKLGQHLLEILFKIASSTKMSHLLLTVFKFNTPAYTFFGKNGFKLDMTDLSKHGKFVDYSIMSRKP